MEIDLRKLTTTKQIILNEEIIIPPDYYQGLGIIRMNPLKVTGEIKLNAANETQLNLNIQGTMILPCAISLEEVVYPFSCVVNEKVETENQLNLALLDILWENVVLEVPMKVVKPGLTTNNLKGDGWEFENE